MNPRAGLPIVVAVIGLSASASGADEPPVRMSIWEVTETVMQHPFPDLAGDEPAGGSKKTKSCQPMPGSAYTTSSLGMTEGVPATLISAYRLTQQPGRRSLQSVHVVDPSKRHLSPWHRFDSARGWVSSAKQDGHGDFDRDFTAEWSSTTQSLERSLPEGEPIRERRKLRATRLGECPPGTPPGPIKDPVTGGKIDPSLP
jgi:hypothetical protein